MASKQTLAERIEELANDRRDTKGEETYGPRHPAVQAALRWHDRMCDEGRYVSWSIGIGGACELRWRALKQWTFEMSTPLRNAWSDLKQRTLLIAAAVIVLIVIGLLLAPSFTLNVGLGIISIALFVVALVVGIVTGIITGMMLMKKESEYDSGGPIIVAIGWTLGFPFAAISFLCTVIGKSRFWPTLKRVLQWTCASLLVLGCAALIIVGIVTFIMSEGIVAFLIAVASLATLASIIFGLRHLGGFIAERMDLREERRLELHRQDSVAQAAAFEKIEPALREAYEDYWSDDDEVISFEDWCTQLADFMKEERGHAWSDFLETDHLWTGFTYLDRFQYLSGDYRLISAVDGIRHAEMTPRKQRASRRREALKFLASMWHLIKYSKLCPNVNLPDLEMVRAASDK